MEVLAGLRVCFGAPAMQCARPFAGRALALPRRSVSTPNHAVNGDIDYDYQRAEHDLGRARQRCGVEHRGHVAPHEITCVYGLPGLCAQLVFQRRKRAESAAELDPCSPERCRQMYPDQISPAQRQPTAGDDKQREARMNDENGVREKFGEHAAILRYARACLSIKRWCCPGGYCFSDWQH